MIAQSLCVLLAAAVAAATPFTSLEGVDPNTLSCDPDGQIFLLLPHFTECNRYYVCDHGKEVDRPCGPGTQFDFPLQTCNHVWATKCWLRGQDLEEGSGSGSGDDGIEEPIGGPEIEAPKPSPVQFQPVLNCHRATSASQQHAYKGDCQRFWRCNNGNLVSAFCSEGLYFNAQTQMCDFEANVSCETGLEDELMGEFIIYK